MTDQTQYEDCTGTPDCPICAEACEHRKAHIGKTAKFDCGLCRADHEDSHITYGGGGTYRPTYEDCEICEDLWYAAQERTFVQ